MGELKGSREVETTVWWFGMAYFENCHDSGWFETVSFKSRGGYSERRPSKVDVGQVVLDLGRRKNLVFS